jgi:hypothetical protein
MRGNGLLCGVAVKMKRLVLYLLGLELLASRSSRIPDLNIVRTAHSVRSAILARFTKRVEILSPFSARSITSGLPTQPTSYLKGGSYEVFDSNGRYCDRLHDFRLMIVKAVGWTAITIAGVIGAIYLADKLGIDLPAD